METEKIELGSNWWEIRKRMTMGVYRASEELSAPYMKPEVTDPKAMLELVPIPIRLKMNRVQVFKATVAWSYGPVTEEIFDNEVEPKDYEIVLRRLNELYGSSPLAKTGES